MCSDMKWLIVAVTLIAVSCSSSRMMQKIRSGEVRMDISVPDEKPLEDDTDRVIVIDSIRSDLSDGPIIMNAIRDSETGEMVATDVINASTIVARFRNVAERSGYVSVSFDVTVPSGMSSSDWQLKLHPFMSIQTDTLALDPLYITGEGYRRDQLKDYQRYQDFLSAIITDTTELVRMGQLEIFLERNYGNFFGVTQEEAWEHYTKHMKVRLNERRKARTGLMYEKYVRDPIVTEGIRLDTVMTASDGDFIYRYMHTFRSRPGLKKVVINILGEIYEDGRCIHSLPFPEDLTFYISSLSSMAEHAPKYRMVILERNVYDNTKALIDFSKDSHRIDTSLSDNASELARIVRCIGDVISRQELILDSLVVTASCSPEGTYSHNASLAAARSEAVRDYIREYVPEDWKKNIRTSCVPENWSQLKLIVANDTLLSDSSRKKILRLAEDLGRPDDVEEEMASMTEYRYLREKIYPQLRSVSFDFHLHRTGVQKDTVHTMELDTAYMAGLEALRMLDYKKAVEMLRPYRDYNSAVAYMAAGYDHSALDILGTLDDRNPKVCYMKALILSRIGMSDEAMKYFELAVTYDPSLEFRANLDPEMSGLLMARKNENN